MLSQNNLTQRPDDDLEEVSGCCDLAVQGADQTPYEAPVGARQKARQTQALGLDDPFRGILPFFPREAAEQGAAVEGITRKWGGSDVTSYRCVQESSGMGVVELAVRSVDVEAPGVLHCEGCGVPEWWL